MVSRPQHATPPRPALDELARYRAGGDISVARRSAGKSHADGRDALPPCDERARAAYQKPCVHIGGNCSEFAKNGQLLDARKRKNGIGSLRSVGTHTISYGNAAIV